MGLGISFVVLFISVLPFAISAENETTVGKPISVPASQYWWVNLSKQLDRGVANFQIKGWR